MRIAVLALAAAVTLVLGATGPVAAQSSPRLELRQFGWQADGTLSALSWNPVDVHVVGAGADPRDASAAQNARVQVVLIASRGSSPQPSLMPVGAYGQDVALPSGVEKDVRLWIYVPMDGPFVGQVQLLGASGQVLAETTAQGQAQRSDIPLVGTVADSSTLAAELGRIEIPYEQGLTAQIRTIELAAQMMPARVEYLQAFRALVLQGSGPATVTGEQRRALQEWVVQGGHLVIAGGPDATRAASVLDNPSAPAMRFGSLDAATDLSPLARWTSPGLTLGTGSTARIEATDGDTLAGSTPPLVQRAAWGKGSVTLLAADPTLDPLRGWPTTPTLLRRALEPALGTDRAPSNPAPRSQSDRPDDTALVGALDALPPHVFPDWQQVAVLLGVFALLAGPVLHLALWRADRRPWLWVAVPVLSLGFTLVIYLLAGALPGRDVIANAVSEVQLDPRTGDARQTVAIGFFAPFREQLTVRSSGELPMRVWLGASVGAAQPVSSTLGNPATQIFGVPVPSASASGVPFSVVTGRDTRVELGPLTGTLGGMRSLVYSRALPTIGRIDTELRIEGPDGLIRGTVRNATPYLLDQVGVGIGPTLVKLGPLAPEQTVPFTFDPRTPPPTPPGGGAYSLAWQMFAAPAEPPSDPDVRRRMRLLDAVLARGDRRRVAYSPGAQPAQQVAPSPPLLIALSSAPIGADMLPSAGAQRTFELSVIDQPLQLQVAPGPFTVLPVLLPPTVVTDAGVSISNNYSGGVGIGPTWVDLRGGAATYTFHAGLPTGTRIDSLRVRTTQSSVQVTSPLTVSGPGLAGISRGVDKPAPAGQDTFRAFNWQTDSWEPLAPGSTETILSPGDAYLSPRGDVRIQVASGGRDRMLRYLAPELTLVGEAGGGPAGNAGGEAAARAGTP